MSPQNRFRIKFYFVLILFCSTAPNTAQELYEMPEKNVQTRWTSFENPEGKKGAGGMENQGAKGHAFDRLKAGESVNLLDIEGSGVVHRIWLTISDRSPKMLRSLRLEMFWDGEKKPAVSVPLGDFFGVSLGKKVPFESALLTDPEGRSFNSFIPMPFKKAARIIVTNDSNQDLDAIFYDINLVETEHEQENLLYFHAYWNRNLKTTLKEDFEILPEVKGRGRFLGTNMGIFTGEKYKDTWWGEGEVKIYLDGDSKYPTLIGSGTEDYVGTAYGQGTYDHVYQGSLIADLEEGAFAFYRYHIPDPVYFYDGIKVAIQQIGGAPRDKVREMVQNSAELIPISVDRAPEFIKLLEQTKPPGILDPEFPDGWTNFYRRDDVSATAYFYLNKPVSNLPDLQPVEVRTKDLDRNASGNE